jgi:hypothetical protein
MGLVMSRLSRFVAALVLIVMWVWPAAASAQEWQLLGRQKASPGIDRDVIHLTRADGPYSAIKLRVNDNIVTLFNVKVVFGDGTEQNLPVGELKIRPGEETVPLDLAGRRRDIVRVELLYGGNLTALLKRPEIEVYGLKVADREPELPPLGREWLLLGEDNVHPGADSAAVELGPEAGRINALIFRVRRNDVRMRGFTVVYTNGDEEQVALDGPLYAGEETRIVELRGRPRFIDRIEFRLRPSGRGGRPAALEAWGRAAPEPELPPLSREWQLIGKQSLDPDSETESIEIGAEDRRYDGLIVRVRRSDLRVAGLEIVYGNGERDAVDLNEMIFAGEDSPIIEIKGRPRFIDRIEISHRPGTRRARPSEVEIWGRSARDPEPPPLDREWVMLGKKRVDLARERALFEVDAIENRVGTLVLRVRGNDIELRRIKLIYQSGDVEELDVGKRLYAGEQTTPVELEGRARLLQRVELSYRAVDRSRRPAEVELWGRIAKDEPFGAGWRRVDAMPVDRKVDKVVYELSRRDGRVRSVGVRASGGPIRLTGIAMMYGNGDKDARPLDDRLRPDATTRAIDVTGFRRAFERIEVYYERSASIDNRTQLELWVKD